MRSFAKLVGALAMSASCSSYALSYPLTSDQVIGEVLHIKAKYEDTFPYYGREYNIGAYALERANPGVDPWIPGTDTPITIPSAFVLPSQTRHGIVVNLPELRLYYFDHTSNLVYTYPAGIGREGWGTPLRAGAITEKTENPTWVVPASILAFHKSEGTEIPGLVNGSHVPPGPDNPLGEYRLRLSIPGYLIHGTNSPIGVGRAVTSGCVRLFPDDIEELFYNVSVGTPVQIINEPIKLGWRGNQLFLEVHPPLESFPMTENQRKVLLVDKIQAALNSRHADIDWNVVHKVMRQQNGVAQVIGTAI